MSNQSPLVIFLVLLVAICCNALPADNDAKINEKENDIELDNDKSIKMTEPKLPKALDPRFNKMLPPPKFTEEHLETSSKAEKIQKSQKSSTTEKAVKDETSTIGNS